MYLIENPYLIVKYLVYLLFIWFFILTIIGSNKVRFSSLIIFLFTLVQLIIFKENTEVYGSIAYEKAYYDELYLCMKLSGLTAFALTMRLWCDNAAWKQALILAFATFVHFMVIYDLTKVSSWFSLFFYNYYDELIIIAGLSQMMVSWNGMVDGVTGLFKKRLRALFWIHSHCGCVIQSFSVHPRKTKKSEKRT